MNHLIVSGLGEKEINIAVFLLHCVGEEAIRVCNAVTFNATTEDKDNPQDIITKVDKYFVGKRRNSLNVSSSTNVTKKVALIA